MDEDLYAASWSVPRLLARNALYNILQPVANSANQVLILEVPAVLPSWPDCDGGIAHYAAATTAIS